MIKVTGMNKKEMIINCIQIEKVEEIPETVITLMNGNKYLVLESADEVVELSIEYKKKIYEAFSKK